MDGSTIEVASFLLADHAEVVQGKLYTMGAGWDRLTLSKENPTLSSFSIATVLRVPWTASNQPHTWEVSLKHEDGQEVFAPTPPGGQFETGRPPGALKGAPSTIMFAFSIANLKFPKLGGYSARLIVDGIEIAAAPFVIMGL